MASNPFHKPLTLKNGKPAGDGKILVSVAQEVFTVSKRYNLSLVMSEALRSGDGGGRVLAEMG